MYPYLRHTIPGVRLAVAKALHTFTTVDDLVRDDWMFNDFFALIFQNVVLEEREEIRELSSSAFRAGVEEVHGEMGTLDQVIKPSVEEWYEIVMTPIGSPFDENLFLKSGKATSGHNVDKHMMAGDLSLVPMETMLQTRLAAAKMLAWIRSLHDKEVRTYLDYAFWRVLIQDQRRALVEAVFEVRERPSDLPRVCHHSRVG